MSQKLIKSRVRNAKIVIIFSILIYSSLILKSHTEGQVYPYLNVATTLVFLAVVIYALLHENRWISLSILVLFIFGLLHRGYIILSRGPLPGVDPHRYILDIGLLLSGENFDNLLLPWYSETRIFLTLGVQISQITSIDPTLSIYSISVVYFIVLFLIIIMLAKLLMLEEPILILVLAIGLTMANSIRYFYTIIPSTMAFIFISLISYVYISGRLKSTKRMYLVVLLLSFVGILTDKFSMVMLLSLLFGSWGISVIVLRFEHFPWPHTESLQNLKYLCVIISSLIFLQWFVITDYSSVALFRLFDLAEIFSPSDDYIQPPTEAILIDEKIGSIALLLRQGHVLSTLTLAAVGFIIMFIYPTGRPVERRIAIFGGISGILVLVAMFTGIAPYDRVLFFTNVFLLFLIPKILGAVYNRRKMLVFTICIIIIVPQLFGTIAVPDHNQSPRTHLNSAEMASNNFITDYHSSDASIGTDQYFERASWGSAQYEYIEPALLTGTLPSQEYYILRSNVEVYRFLDPPFNGWWIMTWDYENQANFQDSKIYSSNGSNIYKNLR